jgi:ABC-type phosphate transport system substrate-binding protein
VLEPLTDDDPRAVGPFLLDGRLGTGAMGRVYLGHTVDGQQVAIKVVRGELADDPRFRDRFRAEVEAIDRVRGPHTAALVDSDIEAAHPWLATDYLPGPSLTTVVRDRGPLPAEEVLRITEGIARALIAIHAVGIVHRDLKPSNVLLLPDGPRVIDFGIARAADGVVLTATGVTPGTPSFISPEQIRGEVAGPQSDVFSLGVVMAFLATGRTPFGDDHVTAILYRIMHAPPFLGEITGPLRGLIMACLDRDPAARPTPAQLVERCAAGPLHDPRVHRAAPTGPRFATHRRAIVALVGVVLLCAGLVTSALARDTGIAGAPVAARGATSPPKPGCEGVPTVRAGGSALFNDVMIRAATLYQRTCPGHTVDYEQGGAEHGLDQFHDGAVDLLATDYPLTNPDELDVAVAGCPADAARPLQLPMIFYPIALSYNLPGVDRLVLDAPTVSALFAGRITRWNDPAIAELNSGVRLPDLPVAVLFHNDLTIMTKAVQQFLVAAGDGSWTTDAGLEFTGVGTGASSNDVLRVLGKTPGAISYAALSAVLRTGMPTAELANRDHTAVALNTSSVLATIAVADRAAAADGGLVLDRDAIYRVGGTAYPLVTVGYHVICSRYPQRATALAVKDLVTVTTTMDTAPASVEQRGYLLPTGALAGRIRATVATVR